MKSRGTDKPMNFDPQAERFDRRAGLSDGVARQIARSVVDLAGLASGAGVLEIGAGTGEIGRWLVEAGLDYTGLDSSQGMLDQFRQRSASARLVCADANAVWPLADASAKAVFGSRVFHLLDADHVAAQFRRVAAPGASLIAGRVERAKDSPKAAVRKKMRQLLAETGQKPRDAEGRRDALWSACEALGAHDFEPVVAARWDVTTRPGDAIDGWRGKDSMGGIEPPAQVKNAVLEQLELWAIERWGALDAAVTTQDMYVLEGVRFQS